MIIIGLDIGLMPKLRQAIVKTFAKAIFSAFQLPEFILDHESNLHVVWNTCDSIFFIDYGLPFVQKFTPPDIIIPQT